jgi:hypothetical protein
LYIFFPLGLDLALTREAAAKYAPYLLGLFPGVVTIICMFPRTTLSIFDGPILL